MFSDTKRTEPSARPTLQPPVKGPPIPSGPLIDGFFVSDRIVALPPAIHGPNCPDASLVIIVLDVPSVMSRKLVLRLKANTPARLLFAGSIGASLPSPAIPT